MGEPASTTESQQESRFLFRVVELSDTEVRVVNFTASEAISTLFKVDLTLASVDEIDFDAVVGKEAILTILAPRGASLGARSESAESSTGEEGNRYFHGIINHFTQAGRSGRFHLYRASLVPSLWLLSLEQDCRIFQNENVPDIVKHILEDRQITSDHYAFQRLQNNYQPKNYCVQYRETDLNFVFRLLQEEGIFYFFEHSEAQENPASPAKHLLVLGDGTVNYRPIPGEAELVYHPADARVADQEFVSSMVLTRQIHTGKVTLRDFDFKRPTANMTGEDDTDSFQNIEVYDYPGEYVQQQQGNTLAQIRLQEAMMFKDKAQGKSTCCRFAPCYTFTLTDPNSELADNLEQEYLLVEVVHTGSQPQVLEEEARPGTIRYANEFVCIPSAAVFRPPRNTPKPVVEGIQTAIVVGPDGEEIYTDDDGYGMVKVKFHWDRAEGTDENSSCWIRVASIFAGGQYGAIFLPRIGQEVLVDFLEGDPDRPIITGRVYNNENMPPYSLPEDKTKSTIKTNSSIGGDGFNEIRFEDLKDMEQIFIHAQRDLEFRTKNDRKEIVENESHLIVRVDQVEKVEGEKHLAVSSDHNEKVDGTISIEAGQDLLEKVGANYAVDAGQEIHLKAGMKVIIEAGTQVSLKAGGSFVDIGPSGVSIQGAMVNINSGGSAGSGSGCSPQSPREPMEADEAQAGRDPDRTCIQAQALQDAAQAGTPFCEHCERGAQQSAGGSGGSSSGGTGGSGPEEEELMQG